MTIQNLITNTVAPIFVGAGLGLVYKDVSIVDGAKEALLAGIPFAAVYSAYNNSNSLNQFKRLPLVYPIVLAGIMAGSYYIGGMVMQGITGVKIDKEFVSIAGGLEGVILGATSRAYYGRNYFRRPYCCRHNRRRYYSRWY